MVMNLEGKRDRSSACITDESVNHGSRGFTFSWTPSRQSSIGTAPKSLNQWPENTPLGVQPATPGADRRHPLFSERKGCLVGPDQVSVKLFKITFNGDPALRWRLLDIVICILQRGAEVPQQQWNTCGKSTLRKGVKYKSSEASSADDIRNPSIMCLSFNSPRGYLTLFASRGLLNFFPPGVLTVIIKGLLEMIPEIPSKYYRVLTLPEGI